MKIDTDSLKLFKYWIKERYSIFKKKLVGAKPPWTKDKILRTYKFCNVYREDDRETIWIHDNWLQPFKKDDSVWFNIAIARLINWHESLEDLGYMDEWNHSLFKKILKKRRDRGEKVFTGAYIVSTNGNAMDKIDYIADKILTPLWEDRAVANVWDADNLESYFNILKGYNGMGSFMAAQVIADLKFIDPLQRSNDWYTWAASGPGSRRGLNRMYGRDKNAPWKEYEWLYRLHELYDKVDGYVYKTTGRVIDCQNLQNCLCEFDKYMRVKNGEGRPRSKYVHNSSQ